MVRRAMLVAAAMAAVAAAAAATPRHAEPFERVDPSRPRKRGPAQGHKQALRKIKAKGGPKRKAKRRPPRASK